MKDPNTGDHPLHLLVNVFGKNVTNAKRILELLAFNHADMNMRNNDLWTPFQLAVKRGCFEAVEAFLNINQCESLRDKVDIDSQGGH